MKRLIFVTSSFPFGNSSSFIENEMEYYDSFDDVFVYPLAPQGEIISNLPKNIHYRLLKQYRNRTWLLLLHLPTLLTNGLLCRELLFLLKHRKFKLMNIYDAILMLDRSSYYSNLIYKDLTKGDYKLRKSDNLYCYSYWMMEHALSAVLLSKRIIFRRLVTRVHGYDLYEERHKHKYLPFRGAIFSAMDYVMPISQNGVDYLRKKYSFQNILLSRLGTKDWGIQNIKNRKMDVFTIFSCSFCNPVKRIHLIIEALKMVTDIKVKWIHFGGGELLNILQEQVTSLPTNIECIFLGTMSNRDILHYYQHSYSDVFVNVSSSEGIPVAIMEALSFGIPTIATNVGGTSEIVEDGINGFLLSENFRRSELSDLIQHIAGLSVNKQAVLRYNARTSWEKNYSASVNFPHFISQILKDSES